MQEGNNGLTLSDINQVLIQRTVAVDVLFDDSESLRYDVNNNEVLLCFRIKLLR